MAILNPDQGGVPAAGMPDQTGASRGQIADRSLGIIAEGVGSAVKSGVDAYNDYNHYQIDQQVRGGFEDANKPYSEILPKDLSKASDTIGALQNAYDQGKLSDVYYTGQLAKLSKGLRSQYPQYNDYIDNTIQSVTGIRPANAFRNALMQQFDKQAQDASDDVKSWKQYEKENEGFITSLMPDYFSNPDKYDHNFIRGAVSSAKATKMYIEQQSAENALLVSTGKMTADRAGESATTTLNSIVSSKMTGVANMTGGGDLIKQMSDMQGQQPSPEQIQGVMAHLGKLQFSTRQELTMQMNALYDPKDVKGGSPASVLGPDEVKKRVDAAMAPIDQMVQYATDGNFGMMTYYANLNKIKGDRDLNLVLNASPELSMENALGKVDPVLAQDWIQQTGGNGTNETTIFSQMTPELVARIAGGKDTLGGATARIAASNKTDAEKASGINSMIDANAATITSGHATPDQLKNAVEGTYGLQKDGSSIFKLIRPEEYNDLFKTMYSKEVTDSIIKSGDKGLLDTYFKSMTDQIGATPDFRSAAKAIQDTQELSKYATIAFVPGANIFTMQINKQALIDEVDGGATNVPGVGSVLSWMKQQDFQKGQQAIKTLNETFSSLAPVLEGMHLKPEEQTAVFQHLTKDLSINLEAGKQQGFFDWVKSGFDQISDEQSSVDPNKGLAQNMAPIGTFDFLLPSQNTSLSGDQSSFKGKVATSESGGSNTADNPGSSALGKYQIIDSTWKGLMRLDSRLTKDGRTDQKQSEIAMDLLTQNYDAILKGDSLDVTDSNRYILHFLGPQDGPQILEAPADDPVSDYVSQRVISANRSVLEGKTVGEVRAWASRHMS